MIQRTAVIVVVLATATLSAVGQDDPDPFRSVIRSTEPLSASDEQATFTLPPGFAIQLVAAEPQIAKPMNLAFDDRGRLWVTDSVEYPFAAPPDRPGRDSVKILEDTTGDGRADRITTFAAGLNIPIGVLPYGDGAIVYSIPNIWYLRDTDGDGRADRREKLYGPFGFDRDTHGMNNAFRRGFDGWIYACHGFNNESTVRGRDGHQVTMQSGNTYRFRPDGSRIEQFTWGQVNPFGMCFDGWGNLFTADCHSKPIYQLLRGGYYPSFGKPHGGLGFVTPMMDHTHGSTAIAGVAQYVGKNFPPEYRGDLFSGNVMTSRINRNRLEYRGSTIVAREQPDFLSTTDPWFRPVDVRVGPDGALYVADFYNRIIGHYEVPLDHPGRDRTRGRIWRIVYTGNDEATAPAGRPRPLRELTAHELVGALEHPTLTRRLQATNFLVDRGAAAAFDAVARRLEAGGDAAARCHALWVLERRNRLANSALVAAATDDAEVLRTHAFKILEQRRRITTAQRELLLKSINSTAGFAARAAADAIAAHPHPKSLRPVLAAIRRTVPVTDGDGANGDGADGGADGGGSRDKHLHYQLRRALREHLRRR